VRRDGRFVPPPHAHFVSGKRKIARRRERSVAATENRNAHGSPQLFARAPVKTGN
jgi:hypothetical protein